MSDNQQKVLGWLAISVLLLATAYMFFLVRELQGATYKVKTGDGETTLSFLWLRTTIALKTSVAGKAGFTIIASLVTISIGLLARTYQRLWQIVAILLVCVAGVALSFELVAQTEPYLDTRINDLRYFGQLAESNEGVRDRIVVFAYAMGAWFAVFGATILGVSSLKDQAALHDLINKVLGR